MNKEAQINKLLTRGVEEIFIKEHLEKELLGDKILRIKHGIDPTGPKIHLGRASVLRKLKEFQDLGHQIVLIIGDFTARIGDPSDKLEKRPQLSVEQIKENAKNYIDQIGKIIDISKTEIHYNTEWLSKMDFIETAQLMDCFTVQQMSHRRNFKDRLDKGEDVFVSEFMYPALQGYDSLMINTDVEIGGFDQLFNLKAGRTVQRKFNKPEQDIMTCTMLEGTDGRKMSTSWGNVVTIIDEPNDMFGKIMAVRDDLMIKYFTLCTDVSTQEIKEIEESLALPQTNPRDIKIRLAKEIVTLYHNKQVADTAEQSFALIFSEGGVPEDIKTVTVTPGTLLADVLIGEGLMVSKAAFRRLIDGNGMHNLADDSKITDPYFKIEEEITLRIGKKDFIKIVAK